MSRKDPVSPWSQHDAAIWHTCDIASAVLAGTVDQRPMLASPFPAQIAPGERLVAQGGFDLLTHRAAGDGSYERRGGMFLSTGRGGLAMTAGVAAVVAAGNRRRRAAATTAAAPRWVLDDQGAIWVSTAGFYLQSVHGLFPWPWAPVQSVQLVGPASVHLQGHAESGQVSWLVCSDWAELIFVLWALNRHPDHPALSYGAWLPPGWRERCVAAGFAPPPSSRRAAQLPAAQGP